MRTPTQAQGALAHECPFCGSSATWPCRTKVGKVLEFPHRARISQLCLEQFLEGVWDTAWCAKLHGHRGRHRTLSGDVTWDRGAGYTYGELDQMVNAGDW